jgi:D-alanyl-D-alanine carboxypeptidase/D-alanyl-D-alanine-endopeptidase (penicillin-binding protein 4)
MRARGSDPARALAGVITAVVLAMPGAPAASAVDRVTPLDLPPPPPSSSESPAAEAAPTPAGLVGLLDRLQGFRQTSPGGTTGVAVIDATGRPLTTARAERPLLPASTMKLLTAAAALRILGPDHRFVTRVYATGPIDSTGVVDGDLVLVGGGDPVLVTPTYRRRVDMTRPATSLQRLARRVAGAGVTRVRGRVVGDGSILATQPLAAGWRPDYLASRDTTRSSGLTVDAGLRMFRRSGQLHATASVDPAARAAAELHRLLGGTGVTIEGPHRTGDIPDHTREVARVASPPLDVLLAHMLRESDNHLADGVFRMLGASTGDPTWRGGARAVRAALTDVDATWRGTRLADGSGLSRANRLTADVLVEVLRTMADGPRREEWLRLLPVTGRSGTVESRLSGTQAVGRVHAKTGTLRDVRALAGTVPGVDGADHHLAVLANGLGSYTGVLAARRLADVLALAVVAAQDGCRGPVPPPEGERPRRAPERLICGARPPTERAG